MCDEETHWVSVWFREHVTLRLLDRRDISYLASLPQKLELGGSTNVLAVHGAPSSPLYGCLYPWLNNEQLRSMLSGLSMRLERPQPNMNMGSSDHVLKYDLYLVGHTHLQLCRTIDGRAVVNPGSVGQPRDGNPRASYAMLDLDDGSIELHRAKYDIGKVVKEIEELSVPEPYLSALKYMFEAASTPPMPPNLKA